MVKDKPISAKALRSVLDTLPVLCYILTPDFKIKWVNSGDSMWFRGGDVGRLKGKTCHKELFDKETPCEDCPTLRTAKSGIMEFGEIKTTKRGESEHYLITSAPLQTADTDGIPLIVEMVQDITIHKRTEEELRRLNQFNAAMIENAPVAIFTIDRTGRFRSVNPAGAVLSGLGTEASEKLLGFNWLENPYTIRCGLADHIRKGLSGQAFELWDFPFTTYRGDKSQFIHFVGVPIRTKDGGVDSLLVLIEDTTERVRIAAQLMQEAKMSAIGRLAAGIAHELNNPLATLVAHSELACDLMENVSAQGLSSEELSELRDYMNIIQEQAFRCKNIIKDLLSLPRRDGFAESEINIHDLLISLFELSHIKKGDISFTTTFGKTIPPVKGDPKALRQVFLNILQNAVDAVETRPGGKITVSTGLWENNVVVEIGDNGVGIPDTIADLIYEPFFTTKGSRKGIGLGLTLCYDFMKKMGGSIQMAPRQGGGSIFKIFVPFEIQKR